jgi:hypothetical protein
MKTFRIPAAIVACALLALFILTDRSAAVSAAGTAAGQAVQSAEPSKAGAKPCCKCDCESCKSGCPEGKDCKCGHGHGGHGMPSMKEGMKKHMEEVRKSVAALRDHEKKMEGITDPAEFRKAAIEHFRMVDGLQESHLKHMESMMGGGGHEQRHHGHGPHGPCKDCPKK